MTEHRSIAGLSEKEAAEIKSMWLPEGKTCKDCLNVRRCVGMFGSKETDVDCQFFPSVWSPKEPV